MRFNSNRPSFKLERRFIKFEALLLALVLTLTVATHRTQADTGICGGQSITLPFNDVMSSSLFCQIAEAYFSGLTNGTTATTYSPANNVTREQMAAFITRTLGQSLRRGSRRAALEQLAAPTSLPLTGKIAVDRAPHQVKSDGADLWVANRLSHTVSRVRGSDGKLLETWTGADSAAAILIARGRVFVAGTTNPAGKLFVIDPKAAVGAVTLLTGNLASEPWDMAFDGFNIWVACSSGVSKVNPNSGAVTTYTGFISPIAITFDGSFMWVSEADIAGGVRKVDLNGNILQTIDTQAFAGNSVFDGVNLWVPVGAASGVHSLVVVRVCDSFGNPVASPVVLATLTGNGLNGPIAAAFDGERIAVVNLVGDSISLWRAADFTPLGVFTGATDPLAICSDGINFWITIESTPSTGSLARF